MVNIREMNFLEAVKITTEGGLVRRRGWPRWLEGMYQNPNTRALKFEGELWPFRLWGLDSVDVLANDWIRIITV